MHIRYSFFFFLSFPSPSPSPLRTDKLLDAANTSTNSPDDSASALHKDEVGILDFTSDLSEVEMFLQGIASIIKAIKDQEAHQNASKAQKSITRILQQSVYGQPRPVALCDGLYNLFGKTKRIVALISCSIVDFYI